MDPKASRRALEKAAASGSMFPKLKDVINCAYFQSLPNMKEYVRSSAFEVEKCTRRTRKRRRKKARASICSVCGDPREKIMGISTPQQSGRFLMKCFLTTKQRGEEKGFHLISTSSFFGQPNITSKGSSIKTQAFSCSIQKSSYWQQPFAV